MDIYGGDAKTIQPVAPGPARRRYPEKNHTDDMARKNRTVNSRDV
jgi:hypothetical protein